jgi:major histocompatibility complex class I
MKLATMAKSTRVGTQLDVFDNSGVKPGVVAYAFNPSTGEAEAGGFLSSRPARSTE